jgi:hypothetical protein
MYKIKKASNIERDILICYKLIKKYLPKKNNFIKSWLKKLKKLKLKDYNEFKKTNKSNNRLMYYDIITAKKNTSFNLHMHLTIELIYVLKGKLYEDRFNKIIPRNKIIPINKIKDLPKGKFIKKINKKGTFLVNDIGSIHNAYTKKEKTILLVLWGRKHQIIY